METISMMIGDGEMMDGTPDTTITTTSQINAAIAVLIPPFADMVSVSVILAMKDATEDADHGATTGLHMP